MEFFSDLIQYGYLSNALAACVLSGITCGVIGTYVVCRRMVFLAGGITLSSFGGLGIAFYLGQELTFDKVLEVLGTVDTEVFSKLLRKVLEQDVTSCIHILEDRL